MDRKSVLDSIHHLDSLSSKLKEFFAQFVAEKKVVTKQVRRFDESGEEKDIDGFFQEMKQK